MLKLQQDSHPPQRGPDGLYQPVAQVLPLEEQFIGGFHPPPSPQPPPLPPKEHIHSHAFPGRTDGVTPMQPPSTWKEPTVTNEDKTSITSSQLTQMTAVERSHALRVARMNPHLQFMVGPLLRYDTIDEQGTWNGAVLIVSVYQCCSFTITVVSYSYSG
jgi:hypothetical protein